MTETTRISPPPIAADTSATPQPASTETAEPAAQPKPPRLEPTRYGDWELNGKCVDF